MKLHQIKPAPLLISLFTIAFCLLMSISCGGGSNTSHGSSTDAGKVSFKVVYHDFDNFFNRRAAAIDCAGEAIATIEAAVYESGDNLLRRGGPWECEAGQGSIEAVPAGSNRTVVILGKDSTGSIVFRGAKSDITIEANSENDAGTIDCFSFAPQLQAPGDAAVVNADAMGLSWNIVEGATGYQVRVSENNDLSSAIIEQSSATETFSPQGLSNGQTYYWQVVAADTYGNTSIVSNTRSFSTDEQHQNNEPTAQISSPQQNSTFRVNDIINFIGSATDPEDGELSGASLVWRSNVDGPIGTGAEINSSTLGGGIHQILLTSTDSEGATGTATVSITINENSAPVAQINSPAQGSTFSINDSITFSGSGNDTEDGALSGDSLVWRSDIDGVIGSGTNFESDNLSSGNHQIRLSVTDSEGATGTATVNITINENAAPVAQISQPTHGSTFSLGENVSFNGSGSDAEDGALSDNSLAWRSNVDGPMGTGESISSNTLSIGTHQITLTATDSDGATGSDSVTITIEDLGPHGIFFLDPDDDVGMYSSIAVEDGKIFIAYRDETHSRLKVARSLNDGYDWSRSSVANTNGTGASIAVDGNNVFVYTPVTVSNTTHMGIAISGNNGVSWNTSQISVNNTHPRNGYYDEFATSIALDGQNIYISYLDSSWLTMFILKTDYSVGSWTMAQIEPPPDDHENGYYSSMNIHNGTLYISNSGYMVGDVYMTKVPTSLSNPVSTLIDQVGVMGDRGYTTSAVAQVGSRTHVYVAFFDQSAENLDLKFGRSVNDGSNFSVSTIDDTSNVVGKYPSMVYSGGRIFVAYYDEANGNLKLARSSDRGDTWDVDPVDPATDDVGRFASLAVEGQKVYISYYDATNKDLKFAKSIDGGDTWR